MDVTGFFRPNFCGGRSRGLKVLFLLTQSPFLLAQMTQMTQNPFKGVTIPPDYDKALAPRSNGSAVEVTFNMHVGTVSPIQSAEMEFRTNFRLTMTWLEPRISVNTDLLDEDCGYDYVIAPPELAKQIWIPDPFISNSKYSEIKKFDGKLANMYLYEDGRVRYTMIINTTVACAMQFEFYPMDIQPCPLFIQSFAHTASQVDFRWSETEGYVVTPMRLIQFLVVEPPPPYKEVVTVPLQGNVSRLVAVFRLQRMMGSHIVQSFIPCCLVMSLGWFSFWLELEVTAARGYLLMAIVLTLQIHLGALKTEFPPVAYVKAVDVWIFGCIFWTFLALTEYMVVKVIYSVTEECRKDNEVVSLLKAKRLKQQPYDEVDAFDAAGLLLEALENGQRVGTRKDGVGGSPYTRYWIWQELRGKSVEVSAAEERNASYRKRRLGSVVLSGRSVATLELPLVSKRAWGWSIPLVWSGGAGEERRVLWREIDKVCRWLFPLSFVIFAFLYLLTLAVHSFWVQTRVLD